MAKYKKCPRCELNYIEEDKDYCDVCLAEMQGGKLKFADLDEEDDEIEKTELCPVCGENYMRLGEKMCDECKKNAEYEEEDDIDPEKDEEWRNYLDDDTEDLSIEGEDGIDFGEDFDDEEEEDDGYGSDDEDSESGEEEDYDFNDDYSDLDDEDDDDDEEDEDDDDF